MLNSGQLIPLLRILSDFGEVLINDDKRDIMVFSTKEHPSPFHHNQWGYLVKMLADTGMKLIWMGEKMLEKENNTNHQLKDIQRMLQDQDSMLRERQELEHKASEVRFRNMKMYMDMLNQPAGELRGGPIYGGNLNDIIVNKPKPLPSYPHVPKAPKI